MAAGNYSLPSLQITLRPGVIDLAWGHPDPALLPLEALRRASAAALDRFGSDALQYGHPAGPGPLREWLIDRIARREGRVPGVDEVVITGGISHGLDQILTLCAAPGDVVVVESPTYHLALSILRDHRLDLVSVPADADGLDVAALTKTLASLQQSGRRARLLYLVPTFNNPTGVSLSAARRAALIDLAQAENLLIVEDDVYRELPYDHGAPPSLWSLAPPGVVARLGSFSKSLAPGLRLGWLTAGAGLAMRMVRGGLLDSGGGVNHFSAMVVAALCLAGDFDAHVARLRDAYRQRRDALMRALRAYLPPGCALSVPGGGFFVWVRLPPGITNSALLPQAEAAGVSYAPGRLFHTPPGPGDDSRLGQGDDALRLAFCLYPAADLEEAAMRLGSVLRRSAGESAVPR